MNASSPDFDSIKQLNMYGIEYWSARDLMPLLGYGNKWQNFEAAIKRAMITCEKAEEKVEEHFTDGSKSSAMPKGGVRETKDYFLTRFACYLIAQNGDPRKPEVAFAQVYFAVSTRAHEMHQLLAEQEERLFLREQIAEGNKHLIDTARQAGVQSRNFGRFHNMGYLGQYQMTEDEIRTYKHLPEGAEILNHMGRQELFANGFRITQTDAKIQREQITGEENAMTTHFNVGRQVRKTIETIGGTMPEDLSPEPSIKKQLDERRRKRKKQLKAKPQDQGETLL